MIGVLEATVCVCGGCELLHLMEYKGMFSALWDQGQKCAYTLHACHPVTGLSSGKEKIQLVSNLTFPGQKLKRIQSILEAHRMLKNGK